MSNKFIILETTNLRDYLYLNSLFIIGRIWKNPVTPDSSALLTLVCLIYSWCSFSRLRTWAIIQLLHYTVASALTLLTFWEEGLHECLAVHRQTQLSHLPRVYSTLRHSSQQVSDVAEQYGFSCYRVPHFQLTLIFQHIDILAPPRDKQVHRLQPG